MPENKLISNTDEFVHEPGDYRERADGGFELRLKGGGYLIQKAGGPFSLKGIITTIKDHPENA